MKLGILGGGQLARMIALAGRPLGVGCIVVDPSASACAGPVADRLLIGDYDNPELLAELAASCDAVTLDFENVPAGSLRTLAAQLPVRPSATALEIVQDRLTEKQFIRDAGVQVPDFVAVDSAQSLDQGLSALGGDGVLKTRRFGYDGKGQWVLRGSDDTAPALAELAGRPAILERMIDFRRELSILVVRSSSGQTRVYRCAENTHRQGILVRSIAPASVAPALELEAKRIGTTLADQLNYVGVLAVELFETRQGELLVNEIAPRVHNSGHWTIEGAVCSQFENHLRAVLDLPLGDTQLRGHSAMVNFIGCIPDATRAMKLPGVHWHDYGKAARPGRKVGHVTVAAEQAEQVMQTVDRLEDLIAEASGTQ